MTTKHRHQVQDDETLKKRGKRVIERVKDVVISAGRCGKRSVVGNDISTFADAKRVQISGTKCTVIDGPFADTKELVAGFMLWEVASMEEAVAWAKKAPYASDSEVEIRPLYSLEDFEKWDRGEV